MLDTVEPVYNDGCLVEEGEMNANSSSEDMVLHFETQETGIDASDTEACLSGTTVGGTSIEGCDAVRVL